MAKKIIIEYADTPPLSEFRITVPPGEYTKAELLDIFLFEYWWQCAEAPRHKIETDEQS